MNHQYPSVFRRVTLLLVIFIIAFNLSEYLLAWARVFYSMVRMQLQLSFFSWLIPTSGVIGTLLTAHIGLLIALFVAYAISFLTPRIVVYDTGLLFLSPLGKQWIPFTALRGIRSTELPVNGRFVVWVSSTKGLPLHGFIGSLLFGRLVWRGFVLTSDLAGFDNIVATLVEQLKQKYGEQNFAAHFSEERPTWQLQMLNAPRATIRQIVTEEMIPITQREATYQMISVAASLMLPMLVAAVITLLIPWGALLLLLVALAEFPIVSLYFTVTPVDSTRGIEFRDAMRIYPLTQLPRWLVSIGLTLLVVAGVPSIVLVFAPIPAILLSCLPVVTLTETWFDVHSPESWLGALVTIVYQLVVYELFVWLLPR